MSISDDQERLLDNEDLYLNSEDVAPLFEQRNTIVYRETQHRWYILAVYWLLSFIQATLWNTWSPITASAEKAFSLSDADISLMENWNNITYTIFIFPFIWLVHLRGLRSPMVLTATLMSAGAFLRCFLYWSSSSSKVWINVGQFFIGIAGPVAFFCCTAISATWFPPRQRTLATALMSVAQSGGVAFSFVIGPEVVKFLSQGNADDAELLREAIHKLMYAEFVATAIILIMVLIYFPSKPPVPPCESAAQERLSFLTSIKAMVSSKNVLLIFAVYSISAGVFSGWYSLFSLAVRRSMDELEAGWLGCWMTTGGLVVSLIVGFLGDRYPKKMKSQLVVLLTIAFLCFLWFTLTVGNILTYHKPTAWIACIIGGSLTAATQPLCYELANEAVFPAPEASVTGVLTAINNVITMLFMFVQLAPIGTDWLNWSQTVSILLCFPFIVLFKPVYNRLEVDSQVMNLVA